MFAPVATRAQSNLAAATLPQAQKDEVLVATTLLVEGSDGLTAVELDSTN